MKTVLASVVCASAAFLTLGCEVRYREPVVVHREPVVVESSPVVEVEGPVIPDAAVAVDVEPAPAERVYVYEPGYPPGCYLYGGFYYVGGYRYQHDVFINRYVTVNVRERRFINVEENRRRGHAIEQRHRTEFATYHGDRHARDAHEHRAGAEHRAAEHREAEHRAGEHRAVEHHEAARHEAVKPNEQHGPALHSSGRPEDEKKKREEK